MAAAGLARSPGRTLMRVVVLAVAAALLGAMLLFVGSSLKTMSAGAVRSVPLDWQGPVTSYKQDLEVAHRVGGQSGVAQAAPAATAPFAGAQTAGGRAVTSAGSGSVLAVPPGYDKHFQTFRYLQGTLKSGQVVLDQQLAATLRARIGGTVRLKPTARSPAQAYRVSGVAVVSHPDVLFQPLNPALGPAPAQPPANVAILPLDTFAKTYAPQLRTLTPASVGSNAQPGAQTGVQWQGQGHTPPTPPPHRRPPPAHHPPPP